MDLRFLDRGSRWYSSLRKRIPALSDSNFHQRVLGVILIALAIFLGDFAHSTSYRAWIRDWKTHHGPSFELWKLGLKSRGYDLEKDSDQIHRVVRRIPMSENKKMIWISQPPDWVVLVGWKTAPKVFTRNVQREVPLQWDSCGSDWESFEAWQGRTIEVLPASVSTSAPRDPRALVF